MAKEPVYDLDALRRGRDAMMRDVRTHEEVIAELRGRIAEYEKHIAVTEALQRQERATHGDPQ